MLYKCNKNFFFFKVIGCTCEILQDALKRYNKMLFLKSKDYTPNVSHNLSMNSIAGTMNTLNVHMINPCEDYPSLNMDEKCQVIFLINKMIGNYNKCIHFYYRRNIN